MIIKNGTVFTPNYRFEGKTIATQGDRITEVTEGSEVTSSELYDASGCYVIPGLTDIHFHGCVGYDFCDGTEEAVKAMASYELTQGVTTICPATMTLSEERLTTICSTAAAYASAQAANPSDTESTLCGINMEGPFINLSKKGAQNPAYIHTPDADMFHRLQGLSGGLVKLLAIAPEEPGALEMIQALKDEVVLSIAHTSANYEAAMKGLDAGATHITHLFNAMTPFAHRDAGVVGAAADTINCDVELICDGIHISPSMVRSTFKLFGDQRVILISDSMMATGMEDGKYALGGQDVFVKGPLATLADGTIAGSATNLLNCMRMVVKMGIPLESAVKAATYNPARSIHILDDYGTIESGKMANMVILNKDLTMKNVIFHGKIAY
ncbi:MAG: N-acetylglucosamine-6-phosphate deacetylase [Lachnospiraceae bacterium]